VSRPTQLRIALVALLIAAAGAGLWWHAQADQRRWAALRPALPAPVGAAAPGLDARLAACHARLAAWPVDRAALAEFAQLCHANGLLPEAQQAYRALLIVDPTEARWPHLLAAVLTGYGRLDEALPLLQQAAELAPTQIVLWQDLGEARLKNNQLPEAEAAFQRVVALQPADVHALFGLARVDLQAGRLTAARSRLQAAVAADPHFPGAQSLLATVFERLGNPEAAEAARRRVSGDGHYTEAPDPLAVDLVAYGHDPYLLLVAASAEVSDGRYARALPLLERGLALAPDDARLHRQLGRTRAWLRDFPGARQAFERAVALAPDDEKIRTELISLLRQTQDQAALAAVVAEGVVHSPDSASLHFEAGRIAVQAGRPDEAIAHFQFVARARPEESVAQCELAKVYFSRGRTEDGIATLLEVLRRQPAREPALSLLVRYGLDHDDPRTGAWLKQALAAGEPGPALTELSHAYQRRYGNLP
jgi:Flp pilus assembly protein TadD